ncbi:MAG TPA: hypothetical protein VNA69_20895 [Thermoanaerobaculia bacterium]|nr:hypothetical protein [Thermoanaerobaculia bacterium]
MRRIPIVVALSLLAVASFAQRPENNPGQGPPRHCCARVYDAGGKEIGEVIRWDDRVPNYPLSAIVRYKLKGGDDVALAIAPESIRGLQEPGGSVAIFTTPDCSGNSMFAMLWVPPLTKRYAMVLPVGNPSTLMSAATNAWLWATDYPPARVSPGATVFNSQWTESGNCQPYPAPGYTVTGTPLGGFWMRRVEDLYAKFKRPFYSK